MLKNEDFTKKAEALKKPLLKTKKLPKSVVEIQKDENAFQGLKAVPVKDAVLPIVLNQGDRIILDLGEHCVGHLNFSLSQPSGSLIADSPLKLKFYFGEFPLEIVSDPNDYKGTLGKGWLQNEEKAIPFMPYTGKLERRYSFRYVMIERTDNAFYSVQLEDIYALCTSAVEITEQYNVSDPLLQRIYDVSLNTLKECEQDVFEDGPKRDRRLWIGDLRLQALTDCKTFNNADLVKRCIYLFAGYRLDSGIVAPCIFPDSPPHVDSWYFQDYSLFFISCLYDHMCNNGDMTMISELYPIAEEQMNLAAERFNGNTIEAPCFIDWCPKLDKSVALLGVYIYTLRQLKAIARRLNKPYKKIDAETEKAKNILLGFRNTDGVFVTEKGQISPHSQVWAVLSGCLESKASIRLLEKLDSMEITMHTPYMLHYYIEALCSVGLRDKAIETLKAYWGKIVEKGFDCCPEVFNPRDEFESPYSAPEINSACHAWSCTPAYWIRLLCPKPWSAPQSNLHVEFFR